MTSSLQALNSVIQARNSVKNTKDENLWLPLSNANWRDALKGISIEDYLSNYNSMKTDLHLPKFRELGDSSKVYLELARRFGKSLFAHKMDEWLR
ncbi:hypothetical protein R0J87_09405 [Halomonas sp. SIMBA_159]